MHSSSKSYLGFKYYCVTMHWRITFFRNKIRTVCSKKVKTKFDSNASSLFVYTSYLKNGMSRCVRRSTSLVVQNWRKSVFPLISVCKSCSLSVFYGELTVLLSSGQVASRIGGFWVRVGFFAYCMAVGQGLSKSFLTWVSYLVLINAVVAVLEPEVYLQSQVPVGSQRGWYVTLLLFSVLVFKHFLNSLAGLSWLLFSFSNYIC